MRQWQAPCTYTARYSIDHKPVQLTPSIITTVRQWLVAFQANPNPTDGLWLRWRLNSICTDICVRYVYYSIVYKSTPVR